MYRQNTNYVLWSILEYYKAEEFVWLNALISGITDSNWKMIFVEED